MPKQRSQLITPRRIARLVAALATAGISTAASASAGEPEELIITATRSQIVPFEVPQTTELVNSQELREQVPRTFPDALEGTPGVLLQRTANGQGSPFLRGATGFRTLLLVDGIRINNSVFRPGANQYWATLDVLTADSLEVVMGPGSVRFGSDAVGGTVNLRTRSAPIEDEASFGGRLHYHYDSSDSGDTSRVELRRTFADWGGGLVLGGSFKNYDDLEAGGNTGRLPATGYSEFGFDGRLDVLLDSPALTLTLASYSFEQGDIERTHATVHAVPFRGSEIGTDLRRRFDQLHRLHYGRATWEPGLPLLDSAQLTISLQEVREDEDRIRANQVRIQQGFEVWTTGLDLQLSAGTDFGLFTYGLEWYHDDVESSRSDTSASGTRTDFQRGPVAGDATYDTFGAYVQLEAEPLPGLLVTSGVRFAGAHASAKRVDPDPLDARAYGSIDETYSAVVAAAGVSYALTEPLRVFVSAGQSFRAPNLADLTRFDVARSGEVEVPAPGLRPERALQLEAGLKWRSERVAGQLAYFYTSVDDQIMRFPTGERAADGWIVEKANVGDGHYEGVELHADFELGRGLSLGARFSWISGELDSYPTSAREVERRRATGLMPSTGRLSLRWDSPDDRFFVEADATIVDDVSRLSPEEERDTQRVPPGGLPGYSLFGLRAGARLREGLFLTVAAENLSNENYRVLGSGVNQPGRHAVIGLDWEL
jgi:hemoglobin/transferrin/lactoferrin receptor protein